MFFEQLKSQPVIALRKRAVADHVSKHDGGEFAYFLSVGVHRSAIEEINFANRRRLLFYIADSFFRRLRGDDFLETRIAAERVPEWEQF